MTFSYIVKSVAGGNMFDFPLSVLTKLKEKEMHSMSRTLL